MLHILSGGYSKDHEDEKEDYKCTASEWTGGDSQKHVSSLQEDDQGADRVAHWTQVHAARWR